MAIETWPSNLQQLINEQGFQIEFGETTLRSEMDVGPQKVRRRYTKPVDEYSTSINIFQSDATAFKQFFNTTLNGGATSFYFNDPFTGTLEVFRFSKPPTISPIGSAGHYRVSMVWEKLP
jgi:hypothetical protein